MLNLWIGVSAEAYWKSGRVALLWTTIYVLFLFALRAMSLFEVGTQFQLRIISGYSSLIPLLGVSYHLFLVKKLREPGGI